MKYIFVMFAAIFSASSPFLFFNTDVIEENDFQFPGWPKNYEGRSLTELDLTQKEQGFVKDFPGKIGRFSDGQRELIIRWVNQPTRKLHPATDCYKGIGYYIEPRPIQVNKRDIKMGCFTATNNTDEVQVCEYIEAVDGESWSDISAWYWGTIMDDSSTGWMSYVIAERK